MIRTAGRITTVASVCALLASGALMAVARPAGATAADCSTLEAVAHRGFHGDDRTKDQNTAESFQRAIDAGYSVETDIRKDADGVLWFFHDRDVSLATVQPDGTPGQGDVEDLSTEYLRTLTYRKAGSPLMTFDEGMTVLESAGDVRAYFEIKDNGVVPTVTERVETDGRVSQTWFTSRAEQVRSNLPDANLLRKAQTAPSPDSLVADGVGIVQLNSDVLTEDLVDAYHQVGVEVQGKTSNSPRLWRETIAAGADGQLTDFPDQFLNTCTTGGPAPYIGSISPGFGPVGTLVTLNGSFFANPVSVTFGGVAAPIISAPTTDDSDETGDADDQIVVAVPDGAPASSQVTVTTQYGSGSFVRDFTIPPPSKPRTVTPASRIAPIPDTSIASGPTGWLMARKATFRLASSVGRSTFSCTLDGRAEACAAPTLTLHRLSTGPHEITVSAVSPLGVADPSPTTRTVAVPRDDTWFARSPAWQQIDNRHAFGTGFLQARTAGATLTGRVRKVREIAILVRRGPQFGDLRLYLGHQLLRTVHTAARPGVRWVGVSGFGKRASGRLRLVSTSDRPVRVDAIGISRTAF